ncbi:hypothetical protein WDU94_015457 [Cyamophila willieti]
MGTIFQYILLLKVLLLFVFGSNISQELYTECCQNSEVGFLSDPSAQRDQATRAVICKPAPYWQGTAVVNGKIKEMKLTDFLGKYVVFFFYPLDFTFVCPTEVLALNERIKDFQKLDTEVIGVSVDSHFTHLAWINSLKKEGKLKSLKISLLSDLSHEISQNYGVYMEDKGHSLRGLFIIDRHGILRQITMNDLPVGRSVEETLRLVQAFQHTDEHGELCPSEWKPGQEAITVPNLEEKEKEEL